MTKLHHLLPLLLLAGVHARAQEPLPAGAAPGAAATESRATESRATEAGSTDAGSTASGASGDGPASSAPVTAPPEEPGVKTLSGMSILGNEEAPKSLVIVPWKSSLIGDEVGVANAMDERARPVDKEVFMREVHYYDLRTAGTDTPQ